MTFDPVALTLQIKKVITIQALHHTYSRYASRLNKVHLSACWTSLGHLAVKPAERLRLQTNLVRMMPLVLHTVQAVNAGALGARELANVAYGAARSVRDN